MSDAIKFSNPALKKTYSNTLKEQEAGRVPHGMEGYSPTFTAFAAGSEPQSLSSSSELTPNVALERLLLFGACEGFLF
ncbi:MAG TPA: hypothetical protein PLB62_12520, partial [Candidatus Sumerlaeota bacterium]|nr:hypothetical protein [Candidatus Sumerlaeota bacterium]